jgi:glycerate kinase
MKILIAPDSFKESLSALEAAQAIEEGVLSVWPEAQCILVPMADGGEGTVNAVAAALQGEMKEVQVTGPLGQPVLAQLALVPRRKLAVIEMAEASGLSLVPIEERDPMRASSYGTGELIMVALEAGCTEILLGLGGSATVDGGMGTLEALGVGLLGHDGEPVHSCGAALASVAFLDLTGLDPRLKACAFPTPAM